MTPPPLPPPTPGREGARNALSGGFGNRPKDAIAYLSAGGDPERVFLINPSSELCRYVGSRHEAAAFSPPATARAASAAASAGEPQQGEWEQSEREQGERKQGEWEQGEREQGERKAEPSERCWEGYGDLIGEIDTLFPRMCSEAELMLKLSRHAALAAQRLPSGATRSYSLERGSKDGGGGAMRVLKP